MAAPAAETASAERAGEALVLRGRLDTANAGRLWREALRLAREPRRPLLVVDAHAVECCDGVGAALLVALRGDQEAGGGRFELHGLREELREVLALVEPAQAVAAPRRPPQGFFESLGHRSLSVVEDARARGPSPARPAIVVDARIVRQDTERLGPGGSSFGDYGVQRSRGSCSAMRAKSASVVSRRSS